MNNDAIRQFVRRELRAVTVGVATAIGIGGGLPAAMAAGGPTGGTVVSGQGSITSPNATTTLINQLSNRLTLNWSSFNIASNQTVRFVQPSSTSVAINDILSQSPSQIFGHLDANGHVVLVNPNGILFGPTAQLNVGSLIASSLEISQYDPTTGRLTFQSLSGRPGVIDNEGTITAGPGGSVVLLGGTVLNNGLVVADYGTVAMGAGTAATLDFYGGGLLRVQVNGDLKTNPTGATAAVQNNGKIEADGGQVLLTAAATQDVFASAVNNAGVVRANRIDNVGGVIELSGPDGVVANSGTLDASGKGGSSTGGTVTVAGQDVRLVGNSAINASGAAGGGTVLVGGGFHGANPGVEDASNTYVGAATTITADATESGGGGNVAVWSNDGTQFYGDIYARGAGQGSGGHTEVSGEQGLTFEGLVNLLAQSGKTGTLLLDPTIEITIEHGANGVGSASDITDGTISTELATANVTITTTNNDILVSNTAGATPGTVVVAPATANTNTLSLDSAANISWNAGWTYTNNGTLTLSAANGTIGANATGEAITLGGSSPLIMQATLGIGSITPTAVPVETIGLATLTATNTGSGDINVSNSGSSNITVSGSNTGGGAFDVAEAGAGNTITVAAGGINANTGPVTLTADAMALNGPVAGSSVTLQPETAGTAISVGTPTAGLQLSNTALNEITTNLLTIGDSTAGDLTVDGTVGLATAANVTLISGGTTGISFGAAGSLTPGTGGAVTLTALNGQINGSTTATTNVTGASLTASAKNGIGAGQLLSTAVGTLSATNTTAGLVDVQNAGTLSASGSNTGGGDFDVTVTGTGNTLTVGAGGINANTGSVTLQSPAGVTLNGSVQGVAITATATAGGITFGTAGAITSSGTATTGTVILTADAGSIAGNSKATTNVTTAGTLTANATTGIGSVAPSNPITTAVGTLSATNNGSGDVNVQNAGALSASGSNTGGGAFDVTATGVGSLLTVGAGGINAHTGSVTLTADAMAINGAIAGSSVTLQPETAGTAISVGTPTAGLQLSNTALNEITTNLLTIGDSTAGDLTVDGTVGLATAANVTLISGGATGIGFGAAGSLTPGTGGAVTLTALNGQINGSTTATTNVTAATLTATAKNGIGSGQLLSTSVGTLSATNTTAGLVDVQNAGALSASGSNTGGGNFDVTVTGTGNTLTVGVGGINAHTGSVTLQSPAGVTLNGSVQGVATTATATAGGITFGPAGAITSTGTVTLTAGAGSIVGNNDATTNVTTAGTLIANATAGIGSVAPSNPITTAVGTLSATNNGSGDIFVQQNTGGLSVSGSNTGGGAFDITAAGFADTLTVGPAGINANTGPVTLTADAMVFDGTVTGSSVTLQPETSGTPISVGAPAAGLQLSNVTLSQISTSQLTIGNGTAGTVTVTDDVSLSNVSDVTLVTGGDISFGTIGSLAPASGGAVTLTAVNGQINGNIAATTNVTAATLTATAKNGIGAGQVLSTSVGTLSATNTTAGLVDVQNAGALSASGSNTGGGAFDVTVTGTGNTLTVGAVGINAHTGSVTLQSPAGVALDGTVTGGPVTVTANGGDIGFGSTGAIDSSAAVTLAANSGAILGNSDPTTNVTGTTLTATAANGIGSNNVLSSSVGTLTAANSVAGNVNVQNSGSLTASGSNTGGGYFDVTLTGAGNTLTVAAGGINANAGSVTLTADAMALTGAVAGSSVTLQPETAGTAISVGTPTAGLQLSNAALNEITTGQLTIGDSAAGTLTVDGAVVLPSSTNVTLVSGGDIDFGAAGSLSAGGGGVTLTALSGQINGSSTATTNATGASLTASAKNGIGSGQLLSTNVGTLTATNSAGGGVDVQNSGALTVDTASTGSGAVTLQGTQMTLAGTVAGGPVTVTATGGDIDFGSAAAINSSGTVTLASGGAIAGNNGATTNVTGTSLTATAANGIGSNGALSTNVGTLSATNSAGGGVDVQNSGALTVDTASTGSGAVTLQGTQMMLAGTVAGGPVTVTATGGDIDFGNGAVINSSGAVTLASSGAIAGNNGATTNVTGTSLTATAANGIGSNGALSTNVGTLSATNSAGGGLDVQNSGALTVDTASTGSGAVTLQGTQMMLAGAVAGGPVAVTATGGDIDFGNGGAINSSGAVTLASSGAIAGNNGATTDVTGTSLTATAANGIGSNNTLSTNVGTLSATNSAGGGVNVQNSGALTVDTASTGSGAVTLQGTQMTLAGMVAGGPVAVTATGGDIDFGNAGAINSSGAVTLASGGAIAGNNGATTNVTGTSLTATGASGIGSQNNALKTDVGTLSAVVAGTSGSINIVNDPTGSSPSTTVTALQLTNAANTAGNVTFEATAGSVNVPDPSSAAVQAQGGTVKMTADAGSMSVASAASTGGNGLVWLIAEGSSSDLSIGSISANEVLLEAGHSILGLSSQATVTANSAEVRYGIENGAGQLGSSNSNQQIGFSASSGSRVILTAWIPGGGKVQSNLLRQTASNLDITPVGFQPGNKSIYELPFGASANGSTLAAYNLALGTESILSGTQAEAEGGVAEGEAVSGGSHSVLYIDWSSYNPNVSLFGTLNPAVCLPADQRDDEAGSPSGCSAPASQASLVGTPTPIRLAMVLTREGWKSMPLFSLAQ